MLNQERIGFLTRVAVLHAVLLLLPSLALAQVITLAPVPPDPASADEWFLTISDASAVKFAVANGTCIDWVLNGAPPGGNGGTAVTTTPSLGASNNDGLCAATVTIQGPLSGARLDFDGPAFSGADVTIGAVTKALVLTSGVWSVDFGGSTPAPPPAPSVTGSSTLAWSAPTQNTDGTPLTNLAGYVVYWGMSSGSYPNSHAVGLVTTYVVDQLTPGTWYFAVSAVNANGAQSALSNVVSKTIPGETPPPPPPPPPADPCKTTPLTLSGLKWPTARTGSRSLSWTSTATIVGLAYTWPTGKPQSAVFTDDRGCTASYTH